MLDLENIEQVSILQKFPRWKVNYNAIRKSGYPFCSLVMTDMRK